MLILRVISQYASPESNRGFWARKQSGFLSVRTTLIAERKNEAKEPV
jgi:hypothetical protein